MKTSTELKKQGKSIKSKTKTKYRGALRFKKVDPEAKIYMPDPKEMEENGVNSTKAIFDTTGASSIESALFVTDKLISGMNTTNTEYLHMGSAALEDLAPRDVIEGVVLSNFLNLSKLSSHMIGLAVKADNMEKLQQYLSAADKSSRLMCKHIETLTSYRTKGKQTISVQHQNVNVNAGAQAIVGNVGGRVSDEN